MLGRMSAGTRVQLDQITKRFGDTLALDRVSLDIAAGELFFLLGPSGCGKSTLLRLIAGLHDPSAGRITFGGRDVTGLSTEKRNAVMCFQSYALWPHMSVRENVRFGLDVRKIGKAEQGGRVDEALRLVQMDEYADRRPNQLSGGQQQRVALARAIVVRPDVLLLDEPLSNLDAKLRNEMRTEIRRICKTAGFTTIYVTHDQKEALSVADRIAVLRRGVVAQVGRPGELYRRPATAFVADFIGQTNLFPATVTAAERRVGHARHAARAGDGRHARRRPGRGRDDERPPRADAPGRRRGQPADRPANRADLPRRGQRARPGRQRPPREGDRHPADLPRRGGGGRFGRADGQLRPGRRRAAPGGVSHP